jgi:hypothetical protein
LRVDDTDHPLIENANRQPANLACAIRTLCQERTIEKCGKVAKIDSVTLNIRPPFALIPSMVSNERETLS